MVNHLTETDGKPSGTKFWFTVVSAITCVRFALADLTIYGFEFGPFDAQGAAFLIGVFGATYTARRYTDRKEK